MIAMPTVVDETQLSIQGDRRLVEFEDAQPNPLELKLIEREVQQLGHRGEGDATTTDVDSADLNEALSTPLSPVELLESDIAHVDAIELNRIGPAVGLPNQHVEIAIGLLDAVGEHWAVFGGGNLHGEFNDGWVRHPRAHAYPVVKDERP